MGSVRAEEIWKQFLLRRDRADSVGQLIRRMLPGRKQRPRAQPFWALRDISFEMGPSTSVGIIGRNGSGKSTLLKLVTRTMAPTRGRLQVQGKVSALIELGAGFHPDFTGRENVVLNGSILGLRRREIDRRMDEIIEFAGIRSFIDTPVKYYSSGMQARLGFSVAINVEPEILIVDEVLSVGDREFGEKCMDRIYALKRQGVSILLVSHDLASVEKLADRALWIDEGELAASGKPSEVIHKYMAQIDAERSVRPAGVGEESDDSLRGDVRAVACYVRTLCRPYGPIEIDCVLENTGGDIISVCPVITLRRSDGLAVACFGGPVDRFVLSINRGVTTVTLSVPELHLAKGQYELVGSLVAQDGGELTGSRSQPAAFFQDGGDDAGVLVAPYHWIIR